MHCNKGNDLFHAYIGQTNCRMVSVTITAFAVGGPNICMTKPSNRLVRNAFFGASEHQCAILRC